MTTTTETITNKQIRALRDEAMTAGDKNMADVCNVALATFVSDADNASYDDEGNVFATRACVAEARAQCAAAIADAEAQ